MPILILIDDNERQIYPLVQVTPIFPVAEYSHCLNTVGYTSVLPGIALNETRREPLGPGFLEQRNNFPTKFGTEFSLQQSVLRAPLHEQGETITYYFSRTIYVSQMHTN